MRWCRGKTLSVCGVALAAVLGWSTASGQGADVTVRVGKTVSVGVWADAVTSDPEGVTTLRVAMVFDARYFTPDTSSVDIGVPGATYEPVTVETIPNAPDRKRLVAVVRFPSASVTTGTTGLLTGFRFKAEAPGASVFTADVEVNRDPAFVASGVPSPTVVVRPVQTLHYRIVVTPN